MESPENSSSWDELARELGATPAPPTEQQKLPKPAAPRREPRVKPAPPPLPKPTPGDWDSLAENLGIEVPPAPQPVEPPRRPEREAAPPRPPAAPAPQQRPAATTAPPFRTCPATASRGGRRSSSCERVAPPAPTVEEPPAPKGAGVSLWHKIFGSPEQQSQKIVESIAEPESAPAPLACRRTRNRRAGNASAARPRGEHRGRGRRRFTVATGRPGNVIESNEGDRIQAVDIAIELNVCAVERDQERDASDEPAHDLPLEGAEREGAPSGARRRRIRVRGVRAAVVVVVVADRKVVTRAANDAPQRRVTANVVLPTRKVASGVRRSEATVIAVRVAISSAGQRRRAKRRPSQGQR